MTQRRFKKYRLTIAALAAVVLISGVSVLTGCDDTPPIEISLPGTSSGGQIAQVYISGEVSNPGFYTLKDGDTIESLIQAAGGVIDSAGLNRIELCITPAAGEETPQRINVNRADVWLLEALPGIGEVKAKAIMNYRNQNGLFKNTNELLNVDGIGESTLENMENLITVAD